MPCITLAADWVGVALQPFGDFCGFCVGRSYQKLLKICYTFHAKTQLRFRSEVILTAEPPFSPGIFMYEVLQVLWDDYKVFIAEEMDDLLSPNHMNDTAAMAALNADS